jgi:hypothetical protein
MISAPRYKRGFLIFITEARSGFHGGRGGL